jgi:thymidylate synthase (FAD)
MAETKMSVKLISHSQLSKEFRESLVDNELQYSDGQAITLSAVRTCYSANKPSEIVEVEGSKYFGESASDGKGGTEADRLFRHIMSSKHTSVNEHLSFTFAIEGISRALLAQLTRHRVGFSFSVQSQRYVRLGSEDRSGGMDYVVPDNLAEKFGEIPNDEGRCSGRYNAETLFHQAMAISQQIYDDLRKAGVPAEDARAVLPNAAATNLVMTANLTALLSFYSKRKPGNGAQKEITELATALKDAVISVEPWTQQFFEGA